jgi:glycosyltransferase involved in cell wall biosynthesis
LALAGNLKVELIAELLRRRGHDVDVISQGDVVVSHFAFYRAFSEAAPGDSDITVKYASALPIKFLNGIWSATRTLSLFKRMHRAKPYDVAIVYNLMRPQVVCADYAMRRGLPVVFEYEDDAFVDLGGRNRQGMRAKFYLAEAKQVLNSVSACIGVSPHLLSKVSASIPQMLLRGVVHDDIVKVSSHSTASRPNRVVYSGTHGPGKGLEQLIDAWKNLSCGDWQLHIAGRGSLTPKLESMAHGNSSIVFHGVLDRTANARLLGSARIAINPHDVSETPGNVFAFKIIEYLAAGAHCVTTPMGPLESAIERGITYMGDNSPMTIQSTLKRVIDEGLYERLAIEAAQAAYGSDSVSHSLDDLLHSVVVSKGERH